MHDHWFVESTRSDGTICRRTVVAENRDDARDTHDVHYPCDRIKTIVRGPA